MTHEEASFYKTIIRCMTAILIAFIIVSGLAVGTYFNAQVPSTISMTQVPDGPDLQQNPSAPPRFDEGGQGHI
jgi:hypothetical protein